MQLMPENTSVSRDDIQNYLNDGMGEAEISWTLKEKGLSDEEVSKILSSLSSYHVS